MRQLARRLRGPARRQAVGLAAVLALGATVVAAATAGRPDPALALVGALGVALFLVAVALRRRLEELRTVLRQLVPQEAQRTRQQLATDLGEYASSAGARADAGHRRLLAAVECERLAAADRHQELLARLRHSPDPSGAGLPPLDPGDSEAALRAVRLLVEQQRPKLVLELGSGAATVWLAEALERTGGRLVSVDPVPDSVERTRALLARHALEHVAEVRPAGPLTSPRGYAEAAFTDLDEVGLVVIHRSGLAAGAPEPDPRQPPAPLVPSLPPLAGRLAAGAPVILAGTSA